MYWKPFLNWYVVHSKPKKELQVSGYLKSFDLTVYHPTLKVNPVNPRSAKIQSYFPRYLFVRANLDEINIRDLLWAPGAVGLVEFGGEPAVVPDEFIASLKERITQIKRAGGLHLEGLEKGDGIIVTHGAFAGHEGVFDLRLSGEQRVQVLLHWLGREIKVKVNANAIEKRRRRR